MEAKQRQSPKLPNFDSRASFPASKRQPQIATESHKPVSSAVFESCATSSMVAIRVQTAGVARAATIVCFRHPDWAWPLRGLIPVPILVCNLMLYSYRMDQCTGRYWPLLRPVGPLHYRCMTRGRLQFLPLFAQASTLPFFLICYFLILPYGRQSYCGEQCANCKMAISRAAKPHQQAWWWSEDHGFS